MQTCISLPPGRVSQRNVDHFIDPGSAVRPVHDELVPQVTAGLQGAQLLQRTAEQIYGVPEVSRVLIVPQNSRPDRSHLRASRFHEQTALFARTPTAGTQDCVAQTGDRMQGRFLLVMMFKGADRGLLGSGTRKAGSASDDAPRAVPPLDTGTDAAVACARLVLLEKTILAQCMDFLMAEARAMLGFTSVDAPCADHGPLLAVFALRRTRCG